MKNRAPAKRVEKISAWRGRDGGGMEGGEKKGGKEGGRGWTRRIQPKRKERRKRNPSEVGRGGGDKKSNLFVI